MEHQQKYRPDSAWAFADYLHGLAAAENRAALAALRRGLGKAPGEAAEAFPYVVPWIPSNATAREEEAYFLVASLFALHPLTWPADDGPAASRNLGASLARLAAQRESSEAVEGRFVALLNAHREDLPEHLRRIIALLKAAEIPVDWAGLLTDLRRWDLPQRPVQRSWAKSFWGARGEAAPESETDVSS